MGQTSIKTSISVFAENKILKAIATALLNAGLGYNLSLALRTVVKALDEAKPPQKRLRTLIAQAEENSSGQERTRMTLSYFPEDAQRIVKISGVLLRCGARAANVSFVVRVALRAQFEPEGTPTPKLLGKLVDLAKSLQTDEAETK